MKLIKRVVGSTIIVILSSMKATDRQGNRSHFLLVDDNFVSM